MIEHKKPPQRAPLAYGSLTKEQFDAEMEKGMADIAAGRVYSACDVEAEMRRDVLRQLSEPPLEDE